MTNTNPLNEHDVPYTIEKILGLYLTNQSELTPHELDVMKHPHHPDTIFIGCVESRVAANKVLHYEVGHVLQHKPVAAVIPSFEKASDELKEKMAFRRLKGIKNIIVMGHSDCGGAQAATAVPHPDLTVDNPLHIVAHAAHRSGLDIPHLVQKFTAHCCGNTKAAGDELAKAIVVQGLRNLMGYPGIAPHKTVEDEIMQGGLNVVGLFFRLDTQKIDIYDVAKGVWRPLEHAEPHFCAKANNCVGCSCIGRIDQNPPGKLHAPTPIAA